MLLANVGDSVQRGFNDFAAWVPHLLGALVILVVGFIVAKVVKTLISRGLHRAGFDRTLHKGQAGSWFRRIAPAPSALLGRLAFWLLMLGTLGIAAQALRIPALTRFVAAIYGYVPNVLGAIAIFVVAAAISAGAGALVAKTMGDTGTGKVVATAVPVVVMSIAGFMILEMLQISKEIVTITYASLMGAIALGFALAFGLGGREVAGRMLQSAYEKGQEHKDTVKRDMQQGKERARQQAADSPLSRDGAEVASY